MCTVTLSYDSNNAQAQRQLTALLATGLFIQVDPKENPSIDFNDPWLYENHGDKPALPKGKETFTPEEAYEIIMNDIRHIYSEDYAI